MSDQAPASAGLPRPPTSSSPGLVLGLVLLPLAGAAVLRAVWYLPEPLNRYCLLVGVPVLYSGLAVVLVATTQTAWRLTFLSATTWLPLLRFSLITLAVEAGLRLALMGLKGGPMAWEALFSTLHLPAIYVFRRLVGSPLGEELLFRGWLLGFLTARMPGTSRIGILSLSHANMLSSVAFALIHAGNGVTNVATAYVCSLVLGAAQERSKSLLVPIWCHFLFNLV